MYKYAPGILSRSLHTMLNYAKVLPRARKQGEAMPGGMHTPWGRAHTHRLLANGVFWIETQEHGGLLIEQVQAEEFLSKKALSIGKSWHAFMAFEQEKDMMVVFYEHPEWYPWMEEELTEQFAEEILRREHPAYFAM